MMPGIGFQRRTIGLFAFSDDILKGKFFEQNNSAQNIQRENFGPLVRRFDILNAFVSNHRSRNHQKSDDRKSGQSFKTTVPIRMIFIGWFGGIFESDPNENRRKHIGSGLDRIRNQSIGISQNTGNKFDNGKENISDDAENRSPDGGFGTHYKKTCQASET